jgi:hypothetical protein
MPHTGEYPWREAVAQLLRGNEEGEGWRWITNPLRMYPVRSPGTDFSPPLSPRSPASSRQPGYTGICSSKCESGEADAATDISIRTEPRSRCRPNPLFRLLRGLWEPTTPSLAPAQWSPVGLDRAVVVDLLQITSALAGPSLFRTACQEARGQRASWSSSVGLRPPTRSVPWLGLYHAVYLPLKGSKMVQAVQISALVASSQVVCVERPIEGHGLVVGAARGRPFALRAPE